MDLKLTIKISILIILKRFLDRGKTGEKVSNRGFQKNLERRRFLMECSSLARKPQLGL